MRSLAPFVPFALLAAGCLSADLAAPGNWGGGSMGRGGATRTGSTNYSIVHLTRDDRIYFVMLVEGTSGGRVSGGSTASGELRAGERATPWDVKTRTGRTGRATIAGQPFQLEDGALFLVNARAAEITVRQVKIDLDAFNVGKWSVDDRLIRLSESNDELGAFLKVCETPK
jgi:hypothetical protein